VRWFRRRGGAGGNSNDRNRREGNEGGGGHRGRRTAGIGFSGGGGGRGRGGPRGGHRGTHSQQFAQLGCLYESIPWVHCRWGRKRPTDSAHLLTRTLPSLPGCFRFRYCPLHTAPCCSHAEDVIILVFLACFAAKCRPVAIHPALTNTDHQKGRREPKRLS